MRHVLAALLVGVAAAQPLPALGQIEGREETHEALKTAQSEAEKLAATRAANQKKLADIQARARSAAKAVQAAEDKLSAIEADLARLDREIAAGEKALAEDEARLNETLAALLRVARRPPETAVLEPGSAVEKMRAARLMGQLGQQVEEQAAALRVQLEELDALYSETETARAKAADGAKQLASRQKEIEKVMAERQSALAALDQDLAARQKRIKALSAKAKSLDAMFAALVAERAMARPHKRPSVQDRRRGSDYVQRKQRAESGAVGFVSGTPFAGQKGRLPLPARGPVVARFGDKTPRDALGLKGLEVETRPGAQVVAPVDGEILYSGQFRSYGGLLIVDVGSGYHMLIAGLDDVQAVVGQRLLAGEPIGAMAGAGAQSYNSPNFAQSGGRRGQLAVSKEQEKAPRLYFELRKGGKPFDPWVWLAPSERRKRG